jgi:hypothetical protein
VRVEDFGAVPVHLGGGDVSAAFAAAIEAAAARPERKFPWADREAEFEDRRIFLMSCAGVWRYEDERGLSVPGYHRLHLWHPDVACTHRIIIGQYAEPEPPPHAPYLTAPCRRSAHPDVLRYDHFFDSWEEAEAWLLVGCETEP